MDLSGKEENPTGLCIFDEHNLDFLTEFTDDDILDLINKLRPSLIVIDAPLSLPKGRCCLEKNCKCAIGGHFRQAERDIRKFGSVLPLTFYGMKMLTLRGIKLANELKKNYKVLESHPHTTQKILEFKDPVSCLKEFFSISPNATEHELDAGILALTGWLYEKNCCIKLGDLDEGIILIPNSVKCLEIIKEVIDKHKIIKIRLNLKK